MVSRKCHSFFIHNIIRSHILIYFKHIYIYIYYKHITIASLPPPPPPSLYKLLRCSKLEVADQQGVVNLRS